MTISFASYLEKTDSISPASFGFSIHGGKATLPLYVQSPTLDDLQEAITQILGGLESTDPGDGRLQRILPMAHPMFPWLYASNISSCRGIGVPIKTTAAAELETPPLPFFALYPEYELTVDFTPRPYAVLADLTVPVKKNQYWYNAAGAQQLSTFAQEWTRFTDYQVHPQPETITAQQGTMQFATQSGGAPNTYPLDALIRKTIPNQLIKMKWYQVPYRYVESANSYLDSLAGSINQNAWYGWPAGSLLYLNFLPHRYTPPVQALDLWLPGQYSTEKWCDIEFSFIQTNRTGTDLPQGTVVPGRPDMQNANPNWLAAGHNLLPWLTTLSYYYATSPIAGSPAPTWPSSPFELLFTDPDV